MISPVAAAAVGSGQQTRFTARILLFASILLGLRVELVEELLYKKQEQEARQQLGLILLRGQKCEASPPDIENYFTISGIGVIQK